jgi:NTP pyrophosphatase (non-canonical NTP hydrolase)
VSDQRSGLFVYDPELETGSRLESTLIQIGKERRRQNRLKHEGRFLYTCADDGLSPAEKLACLTEELGEVAKEVLTREGHALAKDTQGSLEGLRKELTQVAAIAAAWLETLGE